MSRLPNDSDLIGDVAKGDERALARLVTRYAATVRAVARRFIGNDADADEIMQDVFLRVWTHAGDFDQAKGTFATWLYRITANRCFDALRGRRRWSWVGLDAAADQASPATAADDALGHRQDLAMVRQDILALPERQRMALILVAAADRSAQEVAEVPGVSRGAAEQLIVRARQTLRDRHRERMNNEQNRV
jgi:RNA polymerase sigma-70 factor (ECF subfamily)